MGGGQGGLNHEIQPAAENVWNKNTLNKKVSQSLTGLKASCCHDESQTPSAMSVQCDLGAETQQCREASAPPRLFGPAERP